MKEQQPPRQVLGRGLSSLLRTPPSAAEVRAGTAPATTQGEPLMVAISEIRINPRQPRRHFSQEQLKELSASIQVSGVIQPLIVRKAHPGFELIAGERRLRASKMAGLEKVPVVVRKSTDLDQLEVALVENLQRQDLSVIEEALGYERLSKEFSLSHDEIAAKVGKDRTTVTNLMRLLKLCPPVQKMVQEGLLSMGHARALLAIEDERTQHEWALKVAKEGWSVRQVEDQLKSNSKSSKAQKKEEKLSPNLQNIVETLQRKLGTKVEWKPKGKGGEIRIHCFAEQDFNTVLQKILRS